MTRRSCAKCGGKFTQKPGPGRPRSRCEKCSPPDTKRRDRQPAIVQPTAFTTSENAPEIGLVASVRAELASVGRLDVPAGVLALRLAEMLTLGGHTASGAAALARELRATLDSATKDAGSHADALDELSARRVKRAQGA